MKNKQSKGLSLSVNPKHSISERFKASTHGFCHFLKKFESERNTAFSVILGLVPRIHTKQNLNRHPRAWLLARPDDLDSRVKPENDKQWNFTKGLNVVRQCAALLERRVQSSTRVRKAQAVTRQTNECIETAESSVDKVVSSCEKNPNVHKTYMNFLRQRKTALDAPLHAVSSGRSMIEMLGVLAIIGVLSVGGIAGYTKAMEKIEANKQMHQIQQLIYNTLANTDIFLREYNQNPKGTRYDGIIILNALGLLPEDMKVNGTQLYDKYNNKYILDYGVSTCRQSDGSLAPCNYKFSIGYSIVLQQTDNKYSLNSEKQCNNLLNVLAAFSEDISSLESRNKDDNINGYKISNKIYGNKECISGRTCFNNLSPIEITNFCKSCSSEQCYFILNLLTIK